MKKHLDIYRPEKRYYINCQWVRLNGKDYFYDGQNVSTTCPVKYLPERIIDLRTKSLTNQLIEV